MVGTKILNTGNMRPDLDTFGCDRQSMRNVTIFFQRLEYFQILKRFMGWDPPNIYDCSPSINTLGNIFLFGFPGPWLY